MRLFLSHLHKDDALATALKRYVCADTSRRIAISLILAGSRASRSDADIIRDRILAPKLLWAQAVLVLVTPRTCDSAWVRWEIDFAQTHGKALIAVKAPGTIDEHTAYVRGAGGAVCDWDRDQILAAASKRIEQSLVSRQSPPQRSPEDGGSTEDRSSPAE